MGVVSQFLRTLLETNIVTNSTKSILIRKKHSLEGILLDFGSFIVDSRCNNFAFECGQFVLRQFVQKYAVKFYYNSSVSLFWSFVDSQCILQNASQQFSPGCIVSNCQTVIIASTQQHSINAANQNKYFHLLIPYEFSGTLDYYKTFYFFFQVRSRAALTQILQGIFFNQQPTLYVSILFQKQQFSDFHNFFRLVQKRPLLMFRFFIFESFFGKIRSSNRDFYEKIRFFNKSVNKYRFQKKHQNFIYLSIYLFFNFTLLFNYQETIYQFMRGKNTKDQRERRPKQPCNRGWSCSQLINERCNLHHSSEDLQNVKSFKRITNNPKKQVIIILDTYTKDLKPVSILEPFLQIQLVNLGEAKLVPGEYYLGVFSQIYKERVIIKYSGIFGKFGSWKAQLSIYQTYFPKEFQLIHPENERVFDGEIKINDNYTKVLIGDKGVRFFLQPVNKISKYPILKGVKVKYFKNKNNRIQITKVTYPRQIRLTGIIQIDTNSQFYFKSRNPEYDDMNPYFIPTDITKYLQKWNYLFPYSMIKQEILKKEKQEEINSILKGYLLKGYFKSWPLNYTYPIIQLEDEVLQRNFKNMKSAIIFQSGIEIKSFSKFQKTEADKIVKNFKIQKYNKRSTLRKGIFTIDSKQTKCHDDAIYICKLQNQNFQVQIHIADVAQLIKRGSKLDEEVKKRDQTIYIKNYHQPMVPQSLKNMLSLKEEQDKLAFTLAFQVNTNGFIDLRTVQFFRSIINIKQNLTHQQLIKNQKIFPEFFKLNKVLDSVNLVNSNYILECQSKSQAGMTKLIFISAILPTFLLTQNMKRSKQLKIVIDSYLKKMIEQKKNEMEKWEDKITIINKLNKQITVDKKIHIEMQNKINREIQRERNRILKQIKDQEKKQKNAAKQKRKQERKQRKQNNKGKKKEGQQQQSQQSYLSDEQSQKQIEETDNIIDLDKDNISQKQLSQKFELQIEQIDEQEEKKQKQKRSKVMQDSNLKGFISNSSDSQTSESEDNNQLDAEDQKFRMNKAVGGKRYLQSIFSIFNLNIEWKSIDEINETFRKILSKDKGSLYQEYFKRIQIMNRQHFKYILKLVRQEKKDMKQDKNQKKQQDKSSVSMSTKEQKTRQHRETIKKNQIKEEKKQPLPKNQTQIIEHKKEEIKKSVIIQNKKQQVQQPEKQVNNTIMRKQYRLKQGNNEKAQQKIQLKQQVKEQIVLQKDQEMLILKQKIPPIKSQSIQEIKHHEIQQKQQKDQNNKVKNQTRPRNRNRNDNNKEKNDKKKKNKQANKINQPEIKKKNISDLSPEEAEKNIKYKQFLQGQKDKLQKYTKMYESTKNIQPSDDQIIASEQNEDFKIFLRDTKFFFILKSLKIHFKDYTKKQATKKGNEENTQKGLEGLLKIQEILSKIEQPQAKNSKFQQQNLVVNKVEIVQIQDKKQSKIEIKTSALSANFVAKQVQLMKQEIIIKEQQEEKPRQLQQKTTKKTLSKKQLTKKVELLLKPISEDIKSKYEEKKQQVISKIKNKELQIKQQRQSLKSLLQKVQKDYNLIRFLAKGQKAQEEQAQNKRKSKKKGRENKKNKNAFQNYLDNFQTYAKKANYKFKKMEERQIDKFLQNQFQIKEIVTDDKSIQTLNRQAFKLGADEQKLLKWNNPIRSYQSLEVLRLIKQYDWLFQGKLYPTDIIRYSQDIKDVESQLKKLKRYRDAKIEKGETDKKAKEANREIAKLQFYNLIKNTDKSTHSFLTITAPPSCPVKRVFHPILNEVEVKNKHNYPFFKEVKGIVKVIRDFPLQFQVEVLQ